MDNDNYPVIENFLFGSVKLTKNADIDKYKCSGHGVEFDRHGTFLVPGGFSRNIIIFGVDMSSSAHIDNKGKDILILGEGPMQGLDNTTLTPEYLINFSENGKKLCLRLHYNGANSYLLVNGVEIINFTAKDFEIKITLLCLRNVSKNASVDNMKKTGFYGYVYDLSVDCDTIAVDDALHIHKYLMKKRTIK